MFYKLIYYFLSREKYLLLDDMSSAKAKESGLSVVQREMARYWFGNVVTCVWWDHLWLHDAFATYFAYFAMNAVCLFFYRGSQKPVRRTHYYATEIGVDRNFPREGE